MGSLRRLHLFFGVQEIIPYCMCLKHGVGRKGGAVSQVFCFI